MWTTTDMVVPAWWVRDMVRSGQACMGPGPRGVTMTDASGGTQRLLITGVPDLGFLRLTLRVWVTSPSEPPSGT